MLLWVYLKNNEKKERKKSVKTHTFGWRNVRDSYYDYNVMLKKNGKRQIFLWCGTYLRSCRNEHIVCLLKMLHLLQEKAR